MVRILVTGGAGFQGSHLVDRWVGAGHRVTVLDTYSEEAEQNLSQSRDGISVVWGSVTDREIVDKTVRGHDVVVHLAARINVDDSITSPERYLDVNVGGTLNVLEAVRQVGARLIYASSCEVYGYADRSPVTEETEMRPHSPYAASKAAADRMCFAYHKSYSLDVTILRPCNIYGDRQRRGRGGAVIPIFASLAAGGQPLRLFGSGAQTREYMHVSDLVDVYELVLGRSGLSGVTLNAGTGETPSIREIADFISRRMGVSVVNDPPRPGEVQGFALDSSRIRGMGFAPRIKFWDGLAAYLESSARRRTGCS